MVVWESLRLIGQHTPHAGIAALLFFAGAATAAPVLRWKVDPLLRMPRSFASWLREILEKRPSTPRLAAFIFSFNGTMIFLYMLTGIIPGAPYAVAFLTGLNVAASALIVRETPLAIQPTHAPTRVERLCGYLTFVLELPCFWYAMALGMTIRVHLLRGWQEMDWGNLLDRVVAYGIIILPVLALSAAVEAYAVASPYRDGP